ncbi:MAG: rod-binding protein [Alphaproteobacteria bacterium]|nr:rod-binding protein [Alphaproteobacteria bacterium]
MTDGILPLGDTATALAMNPLSALPRLGASGNVDKAAQDFEAMFATQLLQPMFETVPVNDTFGGGHGEEVMRSFLLQEYGKMIAKTGKLGIASKVKAEMLRAQENARARGRSVFPASAQNAYSDAQNKGYDHVAN